MMVSTQRRERLPTPHLFLSLRRSVFLLRWSRSDETWSPSICANWQVKILSAASSTPAMQDSRSACASLHFV